MKRLLNGLFFIALFFIFFAACLNPANDSGNDDYRDQADPAFWFKDIYNGLISSSMVTAADFQYVCTTINDKWGSETVTLEAGTENHPANCEYLLRMIDKANKNTTSFATSSYATTQQVDRTAVDTAVDTLWLPGGTFVAVASNSVAAAYSSDDIDDDWSTTTLPGSSNWSSVTYGSGKFVAVGEGAGGACSTDGITWTAMSISPTMRSSVIYGKDKFVAVGKNTVGAYSDDGTTWSTTTLPGSSGFWTGVAYGNDRFVAVSSDTGAYSTDGINWTAAAISNGVYGSIVYGNGKFVVVTGKENHAGAYSTDGITWSTMTLPGIPGTYWRAVAYGNGRFVAVAFDGIIAYSANGIDWTAVSTFLNDAVWQSVTYGNGTFIAVASNGKGAYSKDGITWTSFIMTGNWAGVAYGGY
jgi:hypothetical protein